MGAEGVSFFTLAVSCVHLNIEMSQDRHPCHQALTAQLRVAGHSNNTQLFTKVVSLTYLGLF